MRRREPRPNSIADATRAYIEEHPSIQEALREDLVNYTLLARKIQAEWELSNEEAITIACRRYQRTLLARSTAMEGALATIRAGRLEIHARVGLVRFRDDFQVLDQLLDVGRQTLREGEGIPFFEIFEGNHSVAVLSEESLLSRVLEAIPAKLLLGVERSLATLAFRSHPGVEETPGVLSVMADELFRAGINILETISVHTDSIFVFRESDVIRAYQVLTRLWETPEGVATPSSRSVHVPRRRDATATPH